MKITGDVIDVRYEYLLPWHFRLMGVVIAVAALGGLAVNPLLALLFIVIGVFLATAYSGTQINRSKNTIKEYNAYFFVKSGEESSCSAIEKIFVNAGKSRQKIYTAHTLNSQTFENAIYSAYIKFEDGKKVQLLRSKDKSKLMNELNPIAEYLNTKIEDNTTQN